MERECRPGCVRQAPVQRFADKVVGPFAGTVMGISAATLAFWSTLGWEWFPEALEHAAGDADQAVLLMSLKLAIDVMVVACPCALGLATPTAVLVGTSMGAHRGLLLRGGDVLEEAAGIDTVVLDKTGTLTKVTEDRCAEGILLLTWSLCIQGTSSTTNVATTLRTARKLCC